MRPRRAHDAALLLASVRAHAWQATRARRCGSNILIAVSPPSVTRLFGLGRASVAALLLRYSRA
jgi:hypothetical protein